MVYWSTSCNKSCRNRPRRHSSSSFVFKSFSVSFPFLHWSVIITYPYMKGEGSYKVLFLYVKISEEKLWYRFMLSKWRVSSKNYIQNDSPANSPNLGRSPFLLEVTFSLSHLRDSSASSAPGRGKIISTWLWLLPLNCCFVFLVV